MECTHVLFFLVSSPCRSCDHTCRLYIPSGCVLLGCAAIGPHSTSHPHDVDLKRPKNHVEQNGCNLNIVLLRGSPVKKIKIKKHCSFFKSRNNESRTGCQCCDCWFGRPPARPWMHRSMAGILCNQSSPENLPVKWSHMALARSLTRLASA